MANKIQLKRGIKSRLSTLSAGEPAFTTDTRELFLGTGSGNVNMSGNKWYNGTDMNGTSTSTTYTYSACPLVKLGDMYLNTATGDVYECTTAGSGTAAKWTYKVSLKGEAGEAGVDGKDGYEPFPFIKSASNHLVVDIPDVPVINWGNLEDGDYVWTRTALIPGHYYCLRNSGWIEGDPEERYGGIDFVEDDGTGVDEIVESYDLNTYQNNTGLTMLESNKSYLVKITSDKKIMVLYSCVNNQYGGGVVFLKMLAELLKPYLS